MVQEAKQSAGDMVIRFGHAGGGHYLRYYPDGGWKAIHAGPHGPENRPAVIGHKSRVQLMQMCTECEQMAVEDSPYNSPELRGL